MSADRDDIIQVLRAMREMRDGLRRMEKFLPGPSIDFPARKQVLAMLENNAKQMDNFAKVVLALAGPMKPDATAQRRDDGFPTGQAAVILAHIGAKR